jgi:hypothetical protein
MSVGDQVQNGRRSEKSEKTKKAVSCAKYVFYDRVKRDPLIETNPHSRCR